MLVFSIDGYQRCNYCDVFADDGGLINNLFACQDCINKREVEDNMTKTFNYSNFEIKDEVYDLELKLHGYEEMLNKYERVRYSDVDFNNRPTRENLEKEFLNLVVYDMEEEIKDNNDYIYIAFENRDFDTIESMKLKFKITNKFQSLVEVGIFQIK